MPLTVSAEESRKGVFVVTPAGSIDSETDSILHKEFEKVLKKSPTEIVLDMDRVAYISSAGVRVILIAEKALKKNYGKLVFLNMQPQIKKVFDIIKALPNMKIFSNIKELDRYLNRMQRQVLDGED